MYITVLDSIYNSYNVVLLFAVCLEDFVRWQNLIIFNKIKRLTMATSYMHAYYERWRIFMALYYEMSRFKAKWKKAEDSAEENVS